MRMTNLQAGWPVECNDRQRLGTVREVGQHYIRTSRTGHAADLYVPASAIANVSGRDCPAECCAWRRPEERLGAAPQGRRFNRDDPRRAISIDTSENAHREQSRSRGQSDDAWRLGGLSRAIPVRGQAVEALPEMCHFGVDRALVVAASFFPLSAVSSFRTASRHAARASSISRAITVLLGIGAMTARHGEGSVRAGPPS